MKKQLRLTICSVLGVVLASCDAGPPGAGLMPRGAGTGPQVKWNLYAQPLPELPLPNDIATWPDPGSPTGLRINASLVTPTQIESRQRALLDQADGFGTFAAISVSFDAPLDVPNLRARHQGDDYDFTNDAVYVVNLKTGELVPIEMGNGNTPVVLERPDNYYQNDPRAGQSNILFETVEEDTNGDGILQPEEDTDFDGVLDHPNTDPPNGDPVDDLLTFYERETNTLILRPLTPLAEQTEYAVILSRRLVGEDRQAVRPPAGFPYINHIAQTESLRPIEGFLRADPRFGYLRLDEIAFAWTFTTQSVTADLVALRRGLYGEGPFARLGAEYPPRLDAQVAQGEGYNPCPVGQPDAQVYVAPMDRIIGALGTIGEQVFGLSAAQYAALTATWSNIDYVVFATYPTPNFLDQPETPVLDRVFDVDRVTGRMRVGPGTGVILITVPRATATSQPPFGAVLYGHGYGSNSIEALGFAGAYASRGLATIGVDAFGHGLDLSDVDRTVLVALFDVACMRPLGSAFQLGRSIDLNDDGATDSGGDYWTAYVFHLRDMVRQTMVDYMQLVRILRTFDGATRSHQDFDGDGAVDLAGDFNADGVADLGGPDGRYYATGGSLGGITSMVLGAIEPSIGASAPISGAGGLTDVGVRSTQGGVKEAVVLRTIGPLVLGNSAAQAGLSTACPSTETSLRFVVPDVNRTAEIEFACVPLNAGDTVIVRNLRSGARRCARVSSTGQFRISMPSDHQDPLEVRLYDGLAVDDFADCDASAFFARRIVDTFQFGAAYGPCRWAFDPARGEYRYQRCTWMPGDPLVTPTEGFGLQRQTPDLRRFLMLAQIAVDPADPINYARHYIDAPLDFGPGVAREPTDVLVVTTIGDMNVPVNGGAAFARAAGLIKFGPMDVDLRYSATPNQVLIDRGVLEGLERLARTGDDRLFDVDDLDEALDLYGEMELTPPLRLFRGGYGAAGHMSGAVFPYIVPHGAHGFDIPDPSLPWDINMYMANLLARYFESGGTDIRYVTDPSGHQCLESGTCAF